jgi:hypothetical protein
MANDKKPEAPKSPVKSVPVDPKKKGALDDNELKEVSGGRAGTSAACTCSNMPSDPGLM